VLYFRMEASELGDGSDTLVVWWTSVHTVVEGGAVPVLDGLTTG
jgi:hypothetical protein